MRDQCTSRVPPFRRVGRLQHMHQVFDHLTQCRYITCRRLPDNIPVNIEVAMYQNITHSDHFSPGNIRRHGTHIIGQRACSLTNDLQMEQKPCLEQFVLLEVCTLTVTIPFNSVNSGQNIA